MSYVDPDYKTIKEFRTAVLAGKKHYPYNPLGICETRQNGTDLIEGPHYPKPHKWYVTVVVENGIVVKVK